MDKPRQHILGAWHPHPAVQILLWICLALLSQTLQGLALVALGGGTLALSLGMGASRLFTLLRRTRWIFASLLLIYGYAMPGDPWFAQLGAFSPSREGVVDGLTQLARLVTVLAGLAVLLTSLPTAQLIAGLYALAYPLRYLGVSRERIAVRLALTLHYAESTMLDSAGDWRDAMHNLMTPLPTGMDHIDLQLLPLGWRDWFVLLAACAITVLGVWT